MTTPAAERLYQAQHLLEMEGRKVALFNPHNKDPNELPAIYGFNNGGNPGWYIAVAIAADGTVLGGHACSAEMYMLHDLGILEGTRPDRHTDQYQPHYPDGYVMVWVPSDEVTDHAGLQEAFRLNDLQRPKEPPAEQGAS